MDFNVANFFVPTGKAIQLVVQYTPSPIFSRQADASGQSFVFIFYFYRVPSIHEKSIPISPGIPVRG